MSEPTPIAEIRRRFTCPGLSIEQPDAIVPCYRAGHKCRSTWEELKDEHGLHQRSFCGCCGEQYGSMGVPHQLLAEWQAAAVPVPDAADETLRQQVVETLRKYSDRTDGYQTGADKVMELIRPLRAVQHEHIEQCGGLAECGGEGVDCDIHPVTLVDHEGPVSCVWCALATNRAHAKKAEAAIERVRARCETAGTTQPPFGQPVKTLTVDEIRAALDGTETTDA